MASLNKVYLIGNLTRKPELRFTPNGTPVAEFGLAVNRHYTTSNGEKKRDTCFVDVTVWQNKAEACVKQLTKGSHVFLEGRLYLDAWETKTGEKRSKLRVMADSLQLMYKAPKKTVEVEEEVEDEDEDEDDTDATTE
ncbi:MAG: single-stranded DNA-binding protein [Planctomycetes bacterium]|jgi:single-strand DNA-binding protein|nr:single-stranded DNA-binding protein [Planctomycetota bacterium]HPY74822.1 single-stranded DNA-binding protein [Planctomycetota bacterium]HQB00462.1 single-stranded DNA-binding protein [Planctomycetota bacterium]